MIAGAILLAVLAAVFGIPAAATLPGGGFLDQTAESARAAAVLADKFHQGDMEMTLLVSSPAGVNEGPARMVGMDIVEQLGRSPFVAQVASPWNARGRGSSAPTESRR